MTVEAQLAPVAGPTRRGVWLAVAVAAVLLVVGSVAVPLFSWIAEQTSTTTWTAAHQVTAVQIEIGSGSVSVVPGRPGAALLRQKLTWSTARPRISETWQGDTLIIAESCSVHSVFSVDDCGAQLELTVPASATVQAVGHAADVMVTGMTGDVHAETQSGDIELSRDSGYVWARAESGEVNGDSLRAQRVDASTVSGDLFLSFTVQPTSVSASVLSGSAIVVVPQGSTYRVSGQTESGSRNVESGVADSASNRTITIDSVSGDADLGYPDQYGP